MPWLQVNVLDGRNEAVLEELMAGLSKTTADVLGVPIESVRVLINEVPTTHWGVGGTPMSQRARSR